MLKNQKIIIIGAGGLGREVYRWLLDLNLIRKNIEIEGFYDANPMALKNFPDIKAGIIGDADISEILPDRFYLCAIGHVDVRKRLYEKIKLKGGIFFTLIHPSCRTTVSCVVGEGSILCPGVILTENVVIEENVVLNINVICGHDVHVARNTVISPNVNINGNVNMEEGVFVGSSAVITPGVRILKNCKITAGSVVYRCLKSNVLLHGNPAKIVSTFPEI